MSQELRHFLATRDGNLPALGGDMRIKVIETLRTIIVAAAAKDVDKLLELKSKLKAIQIYIQSPNVLPLGFIQLVDVILELLPNAPDLGSPETDRICRM